MASPPSKLRILCLHGYRQCDQTFRQKTGSTRKLMKSIADFEFLSAPHLVAADNEVETSRSWWFSNEEAMSFSSKETSDVAIGFETSIEIVTKFIKENGPFDGIMGFSQGASMVHLLLAKNQLGEINLGNIRFAMFFSGFLSLSTKHDNLTSIKIDNVPSIHVFGASDEIVIMSKSEKLADRFSMAPLKIVHEGGHLVPAMSKYKEKINNFLSEQIEKKEKN